MNIMIINGPNLNFIGIREPLIYGNKTYADLQQYIDDLSKELKFNYQMYQSNSEGETIDYIQKAYYDQFDAIIINPGAYTHYSYAIYDALKSVNIPIVEVHLSDLNKRSESFRKIDVIKPACLASFMGEHFDSYKKAIIYLIEGNNYA